MRTTVVRVGQLCGDSVSGGWNEKEWVPALLRGAQVLGAFPQRNEVGPICLSMVVCLTDSAGTYRRYRGYPLT